MRTRARIRRASSSSRLPWYDGGGPSTWPLVLLSDRGITTVDAAVASPNDVSTADWTPGGLTSHTIDTLTDYASNEYHRVYQAVPNMVSGKPVTASAEVKAGTISWFLLYLGTAKCFFNVGTGVLGTATNCVGAITDLGSGWYRCTISVSAAATATLSLCMSTGDTVETYLGNGTGTIQVRNISVTQRNVSAWADVVTGNGGSITQPTAAKQPTYVTSDASWGLPTVYMSAGGMSGSVALAAPNTVYIVCNADADPGTYNTLIEGDTNNSHTLAVEGAGTDKIYHQGAGLIGVNEPVGTSALYATVTRQPKMVVWGQWTDRSLTTLHVGELIYGGDTIKGNVLAVGCHLGADDVSMRRRVVTWLGRKYGVVTT